MPSNVQQAIHAEYGSLGFIPTRVPEGFAFRNWSSGEGGFNIYFGPNSTREIHYAAGVVPCESFGDSMHTFEANGATVEWSATEEDQQVWRCLTVDGKRIVLTADRSVPGDVSLDAPGRLQDAEQLVDLVAYAQVAQ